MDRCVSKEKLKSGGIVEYDILNNLTDNNSSNNFSLDIDCNSAQNIGLYKNHYGIWRLSSKVGAVWLDELKKVPLVVQPKVEKLDAIQMYLELAELPELFSKYCSVFQCFTDEPVIEGVNQPDATLLQVAVFLRELSQFCQRHLRQGFVRVRQNLTGKVKGKILISENLRRNTFQARDDRVMCQFHVMSLDTPANRILKAALMRSYQYLAKHSNKNTSVLLKWARQCQAALSDVPDCTITEADFRDVVYTGLMQKYKQPHQYARMILKRLRTDGSGEISETRTIPYVLDMNRLFEGYVGVLLSRLSGFDFKDQEHISIPKANIKLSSNFGLNAYPDYHEPIRGIVVDAKYKSIVTYQEKSNEKEKVDSVICDGLELIEGVKPSNTDMYQVIAYCKLLETKFRSGPLKIRYKTAALAVPVMNSIKSINVWGTWLNSSPYIDINNEIKLYVLPCPVPMKK